MTSPAVKAVPAETEGGPALAQASQVGQVAPPARMRRRHFGVIISFLLVVLAPALLAAYYLYAVAADQFVSRVSFSIRSEEFKNPLDALGSLGQLSTGTSTDASILNEYIRSQKLVEDIREKLDLSALYAKPAYDPLFAFDEDKPIEDLLWYWHWMTYVAYDPGTGLIDIEAFAFTPEDANAIATAVMDASSDLVNTLSSIAQEDTTRLAKFELDRARDRLTEARVEISQLRNREQIIDPGVDLESQMGVLSALQQQLAEAIIEYDLLLGTTRSDDPRVTSVGRTIDAIENRIAQERSKIGETTVGGDKALAAIVGNFESLFADRQFAEQAYLAAAASYDSALAEARRKSRYLAAHIPPTLAESSQYPNRSLMILALFGSLLLFWMISILTFYAMMDRR